MSQLLNDPVTLIALAALAFAVYWSVIRKPKPGPAPVVELNTAPVSYAAALSREEEQTARVYLDGMRAVKRYVENERERNAIASGLLGVIGGSVDKAANPNA